VIQEQVQTVLSDLEQVRDNLLAISDEIWLSIDHNDLEALDQGVALKRDYNAKMVAFDRLATEIADLLQGFTDGAAPADRPDPEGVADERIRKELDRNQRHALSEDFRYKRPCGFVLQNRAYRDVTTWRRMYELVCRQLAALDPKRFAALPSSPLFLSKRGNCAFAADPGLLRASSKITDTVYAEVNLSANMLRDHMLRLLGAFRIPESDVIVYLRADLDADEAK